MRRRPLLRGALACALALTGCGDGKQQTIPNVPTSTPATAAATAAGQASCPADPTAVAQGVTVVLPTGCGDIALALPVRWSLRIGGPGDSSCEVGIEQPDGRTRSVNGPATLVHGRVAGTYVVSVKKPCGVTALGSDDATIAPESRSPAPRAAVPLRSSTLPTASP